MEKNDKIKCTVCGFESERNADFLFSAENLRPESETRELVAAHFGTDNISVCVICAFKALGVKPVLTCDTKRETDELQRKRDKIILEAAELDKAYEPDSPPEKLPTGYKILGMEILARESFEWLCDEKGYTVPNGSTVMIEKLELSPDGKPFKILGTRTYKKE